MASNTCRRVMWLLGVALGLGLVTVARAGRAEDVRMIKAAEEGNLEEVKRLLDGGADINAGLCTDTERELTRLSKAHGNENARNRGITSLYRAAEKGHVAVIELLVARGVEVDWPEEHDETPLLAAARNGQLAAVEALLRAGANFLQYETHGYTPLWFAAKSGHDAVVRRLAEAGTPVTVSDPEVMAMITTPFDAAMEAGKYGTAVTLIELDMARRKLNYADAASTLLRGVLTDDVEAVKANMDKVEDDPLIIITARDISTKTAKPAIGSVLRQANLRAKKALSARKKKYDEFSRAAMTGDAATVRALLAEGMSLDPARGFPISSINGAAQNGATEVVKAAIEAGLSPHIHSSFDGSTLLRDAAAGQNVELVEMMLDWSVEHGDHDNESYSQALAFLAAKQGVPLLKRLMDLGADVKRYDAIAGSPMISAAKGGNLAAIEFLVSQGADPKARYMDLPTPLEMAVLSNQDAAAAALRAYDKREPRAGSYDSALAGAVNAEICDMARVKQLIGQGANVSGWVIWYKDGENESLVGVAVDRGHLDAAKAMIEAGASPISMRGSLLSVCITGPVKEAEKLAFMHYLIENAANLNASDRQGRTPLMIAAAQGNAEAAKVLLTHHADANLRDKSGRTALEIARSMNRQDVAAMLDSK